MKTNHLVGWNEGRGFWNLGLDDLAAGNRMYDNLQDYQEQVAPEDRLGSSLF